MHKFILFLGVALLITIYPLNIFAVNYHAVIVGVSYEGYGLGGTWTTEYCTKDAADLYDTLTNELGWNPDNISLFIDYESSTYDSTGAKKDDILTACAQMPKGPDDINLFFFSGHGLAEGWLYTGDMNGSNPYFTTYITPSELTDSLNVDGFTNSICYINACHSGSFSDSLDIGLVYSACGANEETWSITTENTSGDGENSLFADLLIQGLIDREADIEPDVSDSLSISPDHNGVISAKEAFDYAGYWSWKYAKDTDDLLNVHPYYNTDDKDVHLYTVGKIPSSGSYRGYASIDSAFVSAPSSGDSLFVANNDSITTNITIPEGVTLVIQPALNDEYGDYNDLINDDRIIKTAPSKKITVYGSLFLNNFDMDYRIILTGSYVSKWYGIEVKPNGTFGVAHFADSASIIIENATTGLTANGSNNVEFGGTVQYCSCGLYVRSCEPYFENVNLLGNSTTGIRLYYGAADPYIKYATVDSSYEGIYFNVGTHATVEKSEIKNSSYNDMILFNGAYANLDSLENNLYPVLPGGYKTIDNRWGSMYINARYNYWGPTPVDFLNIFTRPANVDTLNYLYSPANSGAYKMVAQRPVQNAISVARQCERNNEYSEALSLYHSVLDNSYDNGKKIMAIKGIMRVNKKTGRDNNAVRSAIKAELATAQSYYMASLDYLLCELYVNEGKYEEAIAAFIEQADRYKGTLTEVEMLARIAEIYGEILYDRESARYYADKAAQINPGQSILEPAYASAGIEYNPENYEDMYRDVQESYDHIKYIAEPEIEPANEQNPDDESISIEEFVKVEANPFNPSASIVFALNEPSDVKLEIYSMTGQKVSTLVNNFMSAGTHSVKFDGSRFASGVYFYRFNSKNLNKTGKMLLVK
ncbi:MAG: caspase family protein [Candidatus Latescibacteria bacterium]|nr:caspase family protein [Candidatus Latescibacterota bacterium]